MTIASLLIAVIINDKVHTQKIDLFPLKQSMQPIKHKPNDKSTRLHPALSCSCLWTAFPLDWTESLGPAGEGLWSKTIKHVSLPHGVQATLWEHTPTSSHYPQDAAENQDSGEGGRDAWGKPKMPIKSELHDVWKRQRGHSTARRQVIWESGSILVLDHFSTTSAFIWELIILWWNGYFA